MEIQTTVKDLSRKMRMLNLDPETTIRVIVDKFRNEEDRRVAQRKRVISKWSGYRVQTKDLKPLTREEIYQR